MKARSCIALMALPVLLVLPGCPDEPSAEKVGDKTFVCSNVGTRGTATAEDAEKIVAHCESLELAKAP